MSRLFVFTLAPDHSLRSGQVAIPQDSIVKIESVWHPATMIINGFTVYGDFEQFTRDWWSDRMVINHGSTVT